MKKLSTTHYPLLTISSWLNNAASELLKAGIESARLDSSLLLENRLGKPRDWVIAHSDDALSQKQIDALNNDIAQRKSRVPLAYIIGSKEFYGRSFLVNENVLIPRPESEAMIELLLEVVNSEKFTINSTTDNPNAAHYSPLTITDIGTGSGILAITTQLELPESNVIATDISKQALELAKQNAVRLKALVQFYEADLLDIPHAIKPDIILANLPYVPEDLITSTEITKEPNLALFSGTDGLNHYRSFWNQVTNLPHKPRAIITECLKNQHESLTHLASSTGYKLHKTETLAQLFVQM